MMKRFNFVIMAVLVLALVLAFVACDNGTTGGDEGGDDDDDISVLSQITVDDSAVDTVFDLSDGGEYPVPPATLDLSGLVVTAHYTNPVSEIVLDPADYDVDDTAYKSDAVGVYSIYVTYQNADPVEFTVEVIDSYLPTAATPEATPEAGEVTSGTSVALSCADPADAVIYYTTDESEPTTASPVYGEPIEITVDTIIKAIAVKDGYNPSGMFEASYTIAVSEPATPKTDWYDSGATNFSLTDADELAGLAQLVNWSYNFTGKTVTLGGDIDLSNYGKDYNNGKGWIPIGNGEFCNFKGTFDGQNHTITGLYINNTMEDGYTAYFKGLFGWIFGDESTTGTVKNLILECDITAGVNTGGIAGINKGIVENCRILADSRINGAAWTGGIAGSNNGIIQNCCVEANVNGAVDVGSSNQGAGGIAGDNNGTVQSCWCAAGKVTGKEGVGGIAGFNQVGIVKNCFSTGDVSGNNEVGGIVGFSFVYTTELPEGRVEYCYSTGNVEGSAYIGGVVGYNNSNSITQNCVALNKSVIAGVSAGTTVCRVVGLTQTAEAISSLYADSGLIPENGYGPITVTPGLNNRHGADISSDEWDSVSWWTTAGNWTDAAWDPDIWEIEDGNLPVLKGIP